MRPKDECLSISPCESARPITAPTDPLLRAQREGRGDPLADTIAYRRAGLHAEAFARDHVEYHVRRHLSKIAGEVVSSRPIADPGVSFPGVDPWPQGDPEPPEACAGALEDAGISIDVQGSLLEPRIMVTIRR